MNITVSLIYLVVFSLPGTSNWSGEASDLSSPGTAVRELDITAITKSLQKPKQAEQMAVLAKIRKHGSVPEKIYGILLGHLIHTSYEDVWREIAEIMEGDDEARFYLKSLLAEILDKESEDFMKQLRGAQIVGHLKLIRLIQPITELMSSKTPLVQRTAAEVLSVLGSARALKPLMEIGVTSEDPDVYEAARKGLLKLSTNSNLLSITKFSNHPKAAIRKEACEMLSRIESRHVLPFLYPLLRDKDASVVIAAITAIAHQGSLEAVDTFRSLAIHSPSSRVRITAAKGLGELHKKSPAQRELIWVLESSNDPYVHMIMISLLGDNINDKVISTFSKRISRALPHIRQHIYKILSQYKDGEKKKNHAKLFHLGKRALHSTRLSTQRSGAMILGNLKGNRKAGQDLLVCLRDYKNKNLLYECTKGIINIYQEDGVSSYISILQKEDDEKIIREVLDAIARYKIKDAIPYIISLKNSTNNIIKAAATAVLFILDKKRYENDIKIQLQSGNEDIKKEIMRILNKNKKP